MKQFFSSILAYMFDATENPEYANAAHIKIVKDTDARYPNNLIIVALDETKNIEAMFSFEAQKALEPFEAIHDDNCNCELCELNCPNCADQASIAAPGQTVLCKTHSDDELHFSEMRKFFDEYIQEMILKPHMPFCSRCGADSPDYVLLLRTSDGSPLNFAACANCRDELTLKQNAARAAQKRIVV